MTAADGIGGQTSPTINVTPMIDILLVLLIIFMVIVPVIPRGERALAPRPSHGEPTSGDEVVLEVLKAAGGGVDFRINRHQVARQDLAAELSAIYANRAERVLYVKGDERLAFNQIAEAVDIGHAAGVDRIGLLTPGAGSAH
jgi:biopolymer transport protein TolR